MVDVCTAVGEIQRYYGYFFVDHDQQLFGDRVHLDIRTPGRRSREPGHGGLRGIDARFRARTAVSGAVRRSCRATPSTFSTRCPATYGPRELRGNSPTSINSWAFFAEDSLPVHDRVRLTGALRYEGMDLERSNTDAAGAVEPNGFVRDFRWWSWRARAPS